MSTTMTGGVGASRSLFTNDLAVIKFLNALPPRGYGIAWARWVGDGCYEVSDECAKSDIVVAAVKGAAPPPPPSADGIPRDVELARYRRG